jgi:hypothetical protein
MINYENGIIYKICCNDVNITECYVGSTCSFRARKWAHKGNCNNTNGTKYNLNVYKFIRDNGGWDNWTMVQIEQYEAKDRRDLHSRERYHFEQLNSTLNNNVPNRTQKESQLIYRYNHKREMKEYHKKYNDDNKDKIASYQKIYYQNNKHQMKLNNKIYHDNIKLKKFILN